MDFAEFKNDTEFITSVTNLEKSINAIEKHMALMNELSYEDLSKEDKVKYDLFQTFAINSLFFMYLKLQGIDPSNVSIQRESYYAFRKMCNVWLMVFDLVFFLSLFNFSME